MIISNNLWTIHLHHIVVRIGYSCQSMHVNYRVSEYRLHVKKNSCTCMIIYLILRIAENSNNDVFDSALKYSLKSELNSEFLPTNEWLKCEIFSVREQKVLEQSVRRKWPGNFFFFFASSLSYCCRGIFIHVVGQWNSFNWVGNGKK